ncbi:25S rRNA (adenine(2142)-N(1))-methyltransferase [Labeo rohita]|uniref:25S rRNA (Adenine(2142)-N(1))-methyltransferase n=1 Tax=Labeo rohita TaxID=84645 RepID=A0ABQ8MVW6_LABRO|nr:25S rRNA (adenine(2142)-N(1))-methyltransferase [Labeo rohita]
MLRKYFKKNTKNGLLNCHSCNSCVIRTGCSTHHRFCLKNVLQRFVGAEHKVEFE